MIQFVCDACGKVEETRKPQLNLQYDRSKVLGKARYCKSCSTVFRNGKYVYCPYCAAELVPAKINNGAEEERA